MKEINELYNQNFFYFTRETNERMRERDVNINKA